MLSSWSTSDWMTAVTGELGEAANIVKKLNRCRDRIPGNTETEEELREKLGEEIADTAIYLDLLAQSLGFALGRLIARKFNATSARIGYPYMITLSDSHGSEPAEWPEDLRVREFPR